MISDRPPRIFVSYSHDSEAHRDRVLALSDRLRADGIDAMIDQYVMAPPEGWPAWCEQQIRMSDFVVMVCTASYRDQINQNTEPGVGFGALWEARLIAQYLYDAGSTSNKFVPVLLSNGSPDYIPTPLRGSTIYSIETPDGYEDLVRLLTNQPKHIMPPLGVIKRYPGGSVAPRPRDLLAELVESRGGPRPLREAKLILVGFGGVGKTSLVNRLVNDTFDRFEQKTDGIKITDWSITVNPSEPIHLHIWDFGGQEIMHSTHQFFLTQRSLYLLVLNGRQGREDADADYWLNIVTSFGAESPVIVVLNKIREHPFSVNQRSLKTKFPNVHRFVETDCEDVTGLDVLHEAIREELDLLPNLRDSFPANWFSIKDYLAKMSENYLSFEKFRSICREHGEIDPDAQEKLADFLHILGVALNYRDDPRLRDTNILNPHWVTQGIYKILTDPQIVRKRGDILLNDLVDVLDAKTYPKEKQGFLLELMRKFEICVPFPDDGGRYLIPDLLDRQEPEISASFEETSCVRFEYHYQFGIPEGLIPRFIVRNYVRTAGHPRWRTGVVLEFERNQALVNANILNNTVNISVIGPSAGRRRLLAIIRNDFDRIHATYAFDPEEVVPLPNYPNLVIPYKKLVIFEANGRSTFEEVVGERVIEVDGGCPGLC
jgi:internalin A